MGKKKPPSGVKYYNLTLLGLLICLRDERSWQYIDEIAKQRANEFPLIFGKWSFFMSKGIRDDVIRRLQDAVPMFSSPVSRVLRSMEWAVQQLPREDSQNRERILDWATETFGEEWVRRTRKAQDEIVEGLLGTPRQRLTNIVIFGYPGLHAIQSQMEFMSILKKDPDLDLYIREQLGEQEKEYLRYVETLRRWASWWESLEEK